MIAALVLSAVVSLGATYWGVRRLIGYAAKHVIDVPNERSSHTRPTPRGGGLAVAVVVTVGFALFSLLGPTADLRFAGYWAPAGGIALVGWLDDTRSLRASTRFLAQGVAAAVLLASLGAIDHLVVPGLGSLELGFWPGLALSLLWVVGLTNAFNFMDGIDGIAGSQAFVAGTFWAGLGVTLNEPAVAMLGALIAGSSLGFLGHNWPPARIFMGDVGSTFLGFSLAAAPLLSSSHRSALSGFAVLVVAPFVLDASFTFFRRLLRGAPVFQAHREHLYQRLVQAGWPHRRATLLYATLAVCGATLGVLWVHAT